MEDAAIDNQNAGGGSILVLLYMFSLITLMEAFLFQSDLLDRRNLFYVVFNLAGLYNGHFYIMMKLLMYILSYMSFVLQAEETQG